MPDNVFKTGESFKAFEIPFRITLDDGEQMSGFADSTYIPLSDVMGAVEGVISFSYDVTDNVRSRELVRESEVKVRFMADPMPVQACGQLLKTDVLTM